MPDISYPTLRVQVLQGLVDLKEHFEADPSVLRQGDCPYDPDTIAALTRILSPKIIREVVEVAPAPEQEKMRGKLSGEEQELIETTISDLLKQLNTLGEGETGLDTQTKIQIIKAKATLIDQLLKMHERIMNVKRTAAFHGVVLSILDDYISESDRQLILRRVEAYVD